MTALQAVVALSVALPGVALAQLPPAAPQSPAGELTPPPPPAAGALGAATVPPRRSSLTLLGRERADTPLRTLGRLALAPLTTASTAIGFALGGGLLGASGAAAVGGVAGLLFGLASALASPATFAGLVLECAMGGLVLGMYVGVAAGAVSGLIFGASRGAALAAELAGTRRADLGALIGALAGGAAAAGVLVVFGRRDPALVSPWSVVAIGVAATALGAALGQELALLLDRQPTQSEWRWTPSVTVSPRGAPMVAVAGRF